MKKKLLLILITLAVVVTTISITTSPIETVTKTAIKTADDFVAISNNPNGNYYLANDITLPDNTQVCTDLDKPFSGVFDGNGYSIKGYTVNHSKIEDVYLGIFKYAKDAIFKDLKVTDANLNINNNMDVVAGILVGSGSNCQFISITTSGKIDFVSEKSDTAPKATNKIGGIVGFDGGTITTCIDCTNNTTITIAERHKGNTITGGIIGLAKGEVYFQKSENTGTIKVKSSNENNPKVGGLVGMSDDSTIKESSNTGKITVTALNNSNPKVGGLVGMSGGSNFYKCKNTGDIKVKCKNSDCITAIDVSGISSTDGVFDSLTSCGNSGKITLITKNTTSTNSISGLSKESTKISKCYNTGNISFSGDGEVEIAGLSINGSPIYESYNTGNITANPTKKNANCNVGGLTRYVESMNNCYNSGTIKLTKGNGYVGGLSAEIYAFRVDPIKSNYNSGIIIAPKECIYGALFGLQGGEYATGKNFIYNCYYGGSNNPYGQSLTTTKPRIKKVSKFTKATCSKLSSEYWTYSRKLGRMILKNNKE